METVQLSDYLLTVFDAIPLPERLIISEMYNEWAASIPEDLRLEIWCRLQDSINNQENSRKEGVA